MIINEDAFKFLSDHLGWIIFQLIIDNEMYRSEESNHLSSLRI